MGEQDSLGQEKSEIRGEGVSILSEGEAKVDYEAISGEVIELARGLGMIETVEMATIREEFQSEDDEERLRDLINMYMEIGDKEIQKIAGVGANDLPTMALDLMVVGMYFREDLDGAWDEAMYQFFRKAYDARLSEVDGVVEKLKKMGFDYSVVD